MKLLKMLRHNASLKLLALVFAIGLWLYVLNVEDPEITRSYTVEVSFENEDVLTDADKSYEVVNDSSTIRVTVSAQRSIIEELSASDFTAVADLDDLSASQMEGEQDLEVYVSLNRYSGKTTIVSDTRYATISIEDQVSKEIEVSASTSGKPADGYAVGSVKVLPDTVTVTGVSSLVEQVASASVVVDVSGMENSLSESASVNFYDENGMLLDVSSLTVDDAVNVYVDCDVVKTISVEVVPIGTPADDYRVGEITCSLSEITVQGEEDALDGYETLNIRVDVTDASETIEMTVDPADYLTYGIDLYETDLSMDISIELVEYETVTLRIATQDVSVSGLSDGYTARFDSESVTVTLSVPSDDADSISENDVTLTADLTDKPAGSYSVVLDVQLPDGVYLNASVSTIMTISGE